MAKNRGFGALQAARAAALIVALTALTRPADGAERTHDIVAEDYFTIAHVFAAVPAPDGGSIAYVEMRWQTPEKRRNIDIWIVDTAGKRTRLTFDFAADTNPQWSADSAYIYFSSARKVHAQGKAPWNGKKQVWRMRRDGSDMTLVTRIDDGVGRWQLGARGDVLYYEARKESFGKDDFAKLRKTHKTLEYGHGHDKFTELFALSLTEWRTRKLVAPGRVASDWRVSPDEQRIAMLTTPDSKLVSNEGWSQLSVYDLRTRKTEVLDDTLWRKQAPSPYGWLLGLAWSSDGTRLAHRVDFDGYPGEVFVTTFARGGQADRSRPRTILVPRPIDQGEKITWVGGRMQWKPGGDELCLHATRNAIDAVWCIAGIRGDAVGAAKNLTSGSGGSISSFGFARSDALMAIVQSGLTHPDDVFAAGQRVGKGDGGSGWKRLTKVNPQVDTWKLPTIRSITWKSKDGTTVQGVLELPPDYSPSGGKKLPLVLEIHGGPTSATRHRLRFWIYGRTLFAARGWALLSPNYRGSTGFGDKFMVDLIGHKNDRDVDDLLSGVDKVVKDGIADPNQMAVMGWSNGGYLTNCVIARTRRFKAASSGAGVFDTAMQWMIEDTPGHVINFSKGLPWTAADSMKRSSPLYGAASITTPTLIHVGEKDARVPAGHSRALFRSLYRYLKVPAELVVYPGEPHGLGQYAHRKAKMLWDIAWFDRYVRGVKPGAASEKTAEKKAEKRGAGTAAGAKRSR